MSKERTFTVKSFCTGLGRASNGSANPRNNYAWVSPEYSLKVDENTPLSTPGDLVADHNERCPGPEHLLLIDITNHVK